MSGRAQITGQQTWSLRRGLVLLGKVSVFLFVAGLVLALVSFLPISLVRNRTYGNTLPPDQFGYVWTAYYVPWVQNAIRVQTNGSVGVLILNRDSRVFIDWLTEHCTGVPSSTTTYPGGALLPPDFNPETYVLCIGNVTSLQAYLQVFEDQLVWEGGCLIGSP